MNSFRPPSQGWTNQVIAPKPTLTPQIPRTLDQVHFLILKLSQSPAEREDALYHLSQQRESIPDLAVMLWESPATVTTLLYEILSIYPYMTTTGNSTVAPAPRLASRVCHALTLFQCIAGHEETKMAFLRANIPIYLFPFIHSVTSTQEFECIKLTSLGIIGCLVQSNSNDVVEYLMKNEFVPLCLRVLKFGQNGQEMSKIVAAFIIFRILSNKTGLSHIVTNRERLTTVLKIFTFLITDLSQHFNPHLSKNVIQSFNLLLNVPEVKREIINAHLSNLPTTFSKSCNQEYLDFVENLGLLIRH